MVAEEGLKIGVRLIVTVAFILLGIVCIKMSGNMISSKVSNAAGFAATSDLLLILLMNTTEMFRYYW